jgi:plastocyanin
MSKQRRVQASIAGLAVVGAAALFLSFTRGTRASETPDRVIVLTASRYAFHMGDGGDAANPPLRLRAGERVRVVVRNAEEGDVEHNFKIPGLGVHCTKGLAPGEQEAIEFTVPKDGIYTYTCCSHPGMGGRVEIEGGSR